MRHSLRGAFRVHIVTLVALSAVFVLAGCGSVSTDSNVLAASVNGQGISLATYESVLHFYEASNALPASPGAPSASQDWRTPQGRTNLATSEQGALSFLINLELMRQQLKQRHLTVSQSDIAKNRATLDGQVKSAIAQHDSTLTAVINALTPDVRNLFAEQQADEAVLSAHISVPTVHLRAIITTSLSDAKTWESQVQHGANFGQLAKAHSLDKTSGANGGEFGTVYLGQFGASFDSFVFSGSHSEYAIMPLGNQYALLEITQRTDKPLSGLNNSSAEQTVFSAWLTETILKSANVQRYVVTG